MSTTLLSESLTLPDSGDDAVRRRVLLIAYSFPPVGGAGVQRPAKWAKYLPQFGWDVTVLTPENPSVPVRDEGLLAEVPHETRIVRAPTWEPDYRAKQRLSVNVEHSLRECRSTCGASALHWKAVTRRMVQAVLQPDLQMLWVRNAVQAATKELQRVRHDAIVVTAPPYSALFIGAALKRRFGLPLVFDFRDEWDLSSRYLEQASRGWWSTWIQSRMQRWLLKRADAVLATTQASAQAYQQKLAEVGSAARSQCLYNGFDPDDFAADDGRGRAQNSENRFRLVYTGTLWNLTDCEPLVQAIERLQATSSELVRKLELICVGRKTPEQQRILNRVQGTACQATFLDYCDHRDIAGRLRDADALCLLLSDLPGAERVVPAKLFEYLAAGKPLLTIAPHGEAARLVRRFLPEGHFVPRNVDGVAAWLRDRLARRHYLPPARTSWAALEEFSRPHLTGRLAELLDELADTAASPRFSSRSSSTFHHQGARRTAGV